MNALVTRPFAPSRPVLPQPPGSGVERLLHEAALRAARTAQGRLAVVLHLSRLMPPAPRPHHRRIAQALLQDTAARYNGQVFVLGCGDMVLLCQGAGGAPGGAVAGASSRAAVAEPGALPEIMGRLLRADTPDGAELVSMWPLESHGGRLLAYVDALGGAAGGRAPAEDDVAAQPGLMEAISALVGTADITDIMQRQTAIHVASVGSGASRDPRPLFREVTFSIAALEARIAATGHAGADPFLFRHLAARMDQRMLEVLHDRMGKGGALDGAAGEAAASAPMLHLNLTLPGILSPAFARFAAARRESGVSVGIEVSLIEAVADAAAFARARALVADAGLRLVLDGVSYLSLLLCRPWALRPDMLKLDWSPRLAELPEAEMLAVDDALARIDPARVVLHRAETEAALRWGLAHGIRRFQGRHVDAMLGASRIMGCGHAHGCALRQCIERAAATGSAGRAGCHNTALLDAGAPAPMLAGRSERVT